MVKNPRKEKSGKTSKTTLDGGRKCSYNGVCIDKDVDEDSRIYWKIKASRGWWKPGMSKVYLNITSELQGLNVSFWKNK